MRILCHHSPPNGRFAVIKLGRSSFCIVDVEDFEILNKFHWFAKKSASRYYAVRKIAYYGKIVWVRMHRVLAHTPAGFVCHHKNGDSLDNRKANLENMTRGLHDMTHWKASRK